MLLAFLLVAVENPSTLTARADSARVLMQDGKFLQTAELFHYPPSYRGKKLEADKASLAGLLALIVGELGDLSVDKSGSVPDPSLILAAGSGDLVYWKNYPLSDRATVATRFAKLGGGAVVFVFSRVDGQSALSNIFFL